MLSIGDKVVCNEEYDDNDAIIGETGTIVASNGIEFLVNFDVDVGGHQGFDYDLDGEPRCDEGHGWWINPEILELLYPASLENE